MTNRKWTIGIVNYKSSVYLEYQMKILYEFNDPESFKIIIVDNSFPHEIEELSKIKDKFAVHNNMEIIYFDASQEPWMRGGGQHGQGLNEVLKRTDTKYLLVHDPDFFFVQKNYLNFLEQKLKAGNVSVGAPYRHASETGAIGKSDFPSAFGAAYLVSEIKDLSFMPSINEDSFKQGISNWIEPQGADVGWQMRDQLSRKPYFTFEQKYAKMLKYIFGNYSFEQEPYEYFVDKKRIAYHLFRGTFVADDKKYSTLNIAQKTPEEWNEVRKKCGQYFYDVANKGISLAVYAKVFYRYYLVNFMIIDEILDKIIYLPIQIIGKIINKILFRITHPVAFIKKKIRNSKSN